jgi:diaminohydroxyphosphoribosylaminopyrimidine deaminase/5-amino-6-(5-phosphoribosylamino)uracil reductase
MTGIGTVKDDDPQLTVREVDTPRQPVRVVVDSRVETPPSARVVGAGTLIVAAATEPERAPALQARGAEVIALPNASGKVDLAALMRELGKREMNEVHVEAGFKLNGSLLAENLVDELVVYLAPQILGDASRGMFNLPQLDELSGRRELELTDVRSIGNDIRVVAKVKT